MSLPREQSIFAWCFITPFPFPVKCCWKLIFSSVFWSLSGQKDQPQFSKMLQVQRYALPFVTYAKIKLIQVLFWKVTQPPELCLLLNSLLPIYFYHFHCPIFALSWGFTKVSFWWDMFLGKHLASCQIFWTKSRWEMKLLENILVFVSAVFECVRNCLRKSTKLKVMLWYYLVSVYPPTHPPTYAMSTN